MPGMYAVTSMWFVRRTRAIFRRAEFGFFGVMVRTIVQTPRFWGAPRRSSTRRPFFEFQVVRRAGVSTFLPCGLRPCVRAARSWARRLLLISHSHAHVVRRRVLGVLPWFSPRPESPPGMG